MCGPCLGSVFLELGGGVGLEKGVELGYVAGLGLESFLRRNIGVGRGGKLGGSGSYCSVGGLSREILH